MPATFLDFRHFLTREGITAVFDNEEDCYWLYYGPRIVKEIPSRVAWREFGPKHEDEIMAVVNLFRCFA